MIIPITPLIITLPLELKLQKTIKYSHKHFSDYLSNESDSTIFLQPTDKGEIVNILSSLNSSKASDPNGVNTLHNIISSKNRNFKAIGRFIQTLFHDWCFPFCNQNCQNRSCFKQKLKIRL